MPIKDPKKRRKYMRRYMRDYRKDKKQVLLEEDKLEKLRKQFPSAYELIMGKKKRK